jgi:hypothetical protein
VWLNSLSATISLRYWTCPSAASLPLPVSRRWWGDLYHCWDSNPIIIREVTTNWKYFRATGSACILKAVSKMGHITKKFKESQLCNSSCERDQGSSWNRCILQLLLPAHAWFIRYSNLHWHLSLKLLFLAPFSFNNCKETVLSYLKAMQTMVTLSVPSPSSEGWQTLAPASCKCFLAQVPWDILTCLIPVCSWR